MKKLDNKIMKISSMISIMTLIIISYIMLFVPEVTLEGSNYIKVDIYSEYKEPGFSALTLTKDVTSEIEVSNNINNDKVGTYEVVYKIGNRVRKRIVEVVDNEKPVLTLKGDDIVNVCPNKEYLEEGYEAIDNYDGDITSKVVVNKLVDTNDKIYYEYVVSDSSFNKEVIKREIKILDEEVPSINLVGLEKMTILINSYYSEPGYSAIDNCDGDISSTVIVSGNVDTTKVGTYYINYKITDSNNNTSEITREVKVIYPIIGSNIFLTFDDGPSYDITPKVLDILKEENVKATFFILDFEPGANYLVQRIVNEGHTIAIHGYSHNYYEIYQSVDAYMNNLNLLRNKIKSVTGVDTIITRFPGGSSNLVSSYNPGIMTTLSKEVINNGYLYYDWNVSSQDAGGASTSEEVYYNVTSALVPGRNNIVLMHDFSSNYKTLNALRDIIRYGKDNGYNFLGLTENVPMVTHAVVN